MHRRMFSSIPSQWPRGASPSCDHQRCDPTASTAWGSRVLPLCCAGSGGPVDTKGTFLLALMPWALPVASTLGHLFPLLRTNLHLGLGYSACPDSAVPSLRFKSCLSFRARPDPCNPQPAGGTSSASNARFLMSIKVIPLPKTRSLTSAPGPHTQCTFTKHYHIPPALAPNWRRSSRSSW